MSINTRLISAWDTEETPATTITDYIKSTKSANTQQAWINPPSNTYEAAPTQATVILPNQATPPSGTPDIVTGVSVSESPYRAADGSVMSEVSVSFSVNPSDAYFDHVVIWFINYNGNINPQSMTQATTSPVSFLVETTHETVTVVIQSVGSTGLATTLDSSPAVLLPLNGWTSGPPAPSIVQTLTTTPTGYQFQFAQIGGLAADQIQSYQVLRNTTNTPGTASAIHTYPQADNVTGYTYTFQDAVPNGTTYYYWVRACNTSGLFSSMVAAQTGAIVNGSQLNSLGQLINADQIAADGATYARILASQLQANHLPGYIASNNLSNPLFADTSGSSSSGNLPVGAWVSRDWQITQNDGNDWYTGIGFDASLSPYTSYLLARLPNNTTIGTGVTTYITEPRYIPVRNGDIVCAGWAGDIQANATVAGISVLMFADIIITDANGTQLAENNDGASISTVNTGISNHAWVYPVNFTGAGQAFAKLRLIVQVNNTTGSSFFTGTDLLCDARFSNILFGLASNTGGPGVAKYGSMPMTGSSPLSYTTTTTTVDWSGTLTGYRTDVKMTPFSGAYSQTVTGLTAGSTYDYYPYWDDNVANLDSTTNAQSVQFTQNNGVVSGGVGSPAMAFPGGSNQALQFVLRSDHIPIGSGPISVAQPASGTGGGSGGGGGNGSQGTCPRSDMKVRHRDLGVITAGQLADEFAKCGDHYIANLHGWTKVTNIETSERSEWLEVDFGLDSFMGTPHHNWPTEDGLVLSSHLYGHKINTIKGKRKHKATYPNYNYGTAVKIEVESPHTYLCGTRLPSLLTHNPMVPC